MSLSLTAEDVRLLTEAQQTILAPHGPHEPAEWARRVLGKVAGMLGADSGGIILTTPRAEDPPLAEVLNVSPEAVRAYGEYYAGRELLRPSAVPTVQYLPDEVDRRTLESSEIYNDFWKPSRQFDNLALTIPLADGGGAGLFFHKATRAGPRFGERGKALLRLLLPAVVSGVRTYVDWAGRHGKLLRFLDRVEDGLLLCDPVGRVRHQNASLTRLLSSDPDSVRVRETAEDLARRLVPSARGERVPEEESLVAAVPLRVVTDRRAYRIRGTRLDAGAAGGPGVLITIKVEGTQLPSASVLAERFDLTPRQAEVALLLARRKTNDEVAQLLGISPHTARRHTETVFLKVGVSSRLDVQEAVVG